MNLWANFSHSSYRDLFLEDLGSVLLFGLLLRVLLDLRPPELFHLAAGLGLSLLLDLHGCLVRIDLDQLLIQVRLLDDLSGRSFRLFGTKGTQSVRLRKRSFHIVSLTSI